MRVGDLVKVKELPGTKLASKRKPLWAVITRVGTLYDKPQDQSCSVEFVSIVGGKRWAPYYLRRANIDLLSKPESQVPNWVWAEIAKRALLNEGDN